jgi:hypothetical protein
MIHRNSLAKVLVAIVGAGAMLSGCAKKGDTTVVAPAPPAWLAYYPLAVGYWWNYQNWQLDSMGMKVAGSDGMRMDSIVADTTIGSRKGWIISKTTSGGGSSRSVWGFDANGMLQNYADTSSGGTGVYAWMNFADLGHMSKGVLWSFTVPFMLPPIPPFTVDTIRGTQSQKQVFAGDTSVTFPAGTFSAKHYVDSLSAQFVFIVLPVTVSQNEHFYFAKNVGLVGTHQPAPNMGGLPNLGAGAPTGSHEELVSFNVK